jgi:class 3 adenylate cyclase
MNGKRAILLIIGVVVCAPLLALYHYGVFPSLARWLEGVYRQAFMLRPEPLTLHIPVQYAFYTAMAFISAWACGEMPRQSRKFGFMSGAAFLTFTLSPALALNGMIFEPFSGVAAILGGGLLGLAVSETEKGRRQHVLRQYFIGRLSSAGFDRLLIARHPVKLTGRRELTVVSCRVLNYPELGAELDAEEMEKLSSGFLKVVAEFLVTKGGYLDACNAEGVRVLFGFPLHDENHAAHACHVALELRQRLVNLAQEIENRWHKKPRLGVALASGEMTCGLFGYRDFQFYSAVGESLDFSRRLCALNAVYGSHLLISARTHALVQGQMEMRPMEMVFAPHIHEVSEVYELIGEKGTLTDDEVRARDAFWQGVVNLRKGDYKKALESLGAAKMENRDDAPLRYFLERAEAGAREDTDATDHSGATRHVRLLMAT